MAGEHATFRCPTCKKRLTNRDDPDFPFCSDRCRLIDLGKWASGAYVISSPVDDISDGVEDSRPPGSDEEY
ncbi:MAG: DNA gyrase inhibitor YacG [Terriglobales bacterium]